MAAKLSKKSSGGKPRGKPFVKGDPRRMQARGPKKGAPNAGRPPDEWKARMRSLRDRWLVAAEAAKVVDDVDHPLYERLGKFFHESVDGKATQPIDGTLTVSIAETIAAARKRARQP